MVIEEIKPDISSIPNGYLEWREKIALLIEQSKLKAIMNVNTEMLTLYWNIGNDILTKQREEGWGANVVNKLSKDLSKRFRNDKGYSARNLNYMKAFAEAYHDFPILQVPLAQLGELPVNQQVIGDLTRNGEFVQVPLAQISWYHHISLLAKVKGKVERAFYITETARNGWSRDTMLSKIASGYIKSVGYSINNFESTLPSFQSDMAKFAFKDPYNFNFLGMVALQNELDIEKQLTRKIADFLLEMGNGFAYMGEQYHVSVDGDDYYIDVLMYHTKLHCYVVVELKAVEFVPEFVGKLNFYISAVDEYVKAPEDNPTIGLLLCRAKSDKKAAFSLRGITQPMGIAQYEIEQLFKDMASALPQIEDLEEEIYRDPEITQEQSEFLG